MTFWSAFLRTLRWRPVQALGGLYWHVTRRKVRARNRLRMGVAQAPYAYEFWIESAERNPALAPRVQGIVEQWRCRPNFSILLHGSAHATSTQIARTIASIEAQYYGDWELLVAGAHVMDIANSALGSERVIQLPSTTASISRELETGIAAVRGDFIVPLRAGNLLSPSALFRLAEACQANGKPSIIYGDQDEIDKRGRRSQPWFKPQWDEEMLLAQDYVSEACAIDLPLSRSVMPLADAGDDAAAFALVLAASKAAPGPIVHVDHVLCHVDPEARRSNQAARVAAVDSYLQVLGGTSAPGPFDTVKVSWPLPDDAPAVSIIIPTRDKVELLRACVDSVLKSTSYPNFELIIIDNGSTERAALEYLSQIAGEPNVRVIGYDYPYNYSAINNFAAGLSSSPYLCLLNNDTEVIGDEWLSELMRYALRPEVGAVGAKLLYDDGTIQHAGVIIGICEAAGHAHRFERSDQPGYFGQPHITHQVSAVTAACLVVEKRKFDAVGGLDAEHLAVAYNDVDLCLKLEQAGWRNMYVPHALLLHHESKSRGQDSSPKNIDRYMRELAILQERWSTKSYEDRRHHRNLDRYSETFILRL